MTSIELALEIGTAGKDRRKQYASEGRAEALGPPFVKVVDRAMNFLAPALALADNREKLEREIVRLDETRPHSPSSSDVSGPAGCARISTGSSGSPATRQARKRCSLPAPGFRTEWGSRTLVRRSKSYLSMSRSACRRVISSSY